MCQYTIFVETNAPAFHMVDDELTEMDPRLPNKYAKMMAAADYMYYVIPKMENGVSGGVVRVIFPTKDTNISFDLLN